MIKTSLRSGEYERLGTVRSRQDHPGTNQSITSNLTGAALMLCLISSTTTLWLAFELPFLAKELHNNFLVLAVGLLLILYTYIYFFRSMCTDPGMIQPPSGAERAILNGQLKLHRVASNKLNQLVYDIEVKGVLVKCKYCVTCQMVRPPRSSHCPICSKCIAMRDHHCPFLSTCIGMRNYRFFILFLIFFLHTDLFFFITSLVKMRINTGERTFLQSLPAYFILLITGPSALYTCNLLGYHCMISSRALTTREDDKGIYTQENPFNTRQWYLNLGRRLCTSLPPSIYGAHRLMKETV